MTRLLAAVYLFVVERSVRLFGADISGAALRRFSGIVDGIQTIDDYLGGKPANLVIGDDRGSGTFGTSISNNQHWPPVIAEGDNPNVPPPPQVG